jgi:hypothetical protein
MRLNDGRESALVTPSIEEEKPGRPHSALLLVVRTGGLDRVVKLSR